MTRETEHRLDLEFERKLADRIEGLLQEAGPSGMTMDDLARALRGEGWRASDRRLHRILRALEEMGRVARRPEPRGRGRPRVRLVHASRLSAEASLGPLFDAAPRFVPKDASEDYRAVVLPPEERKRLEEEYGWIARVSLDHLLAEDVARALREAAPDLARSDPRRLLLDMARWSIRILREARRELLDAIKEKDASRAEAARSRLEERARFARRYFMDLCGLRPPLYPGDEDWAIRIEMDVQRWRDPETPDDELFGLREEAARKELERRVLGESVVELADLDGAPPVEAFAATDASRGSLMIKVGGRGTYEQPEEIEIFSSAASLQILLKGMRPPPLLDFEIDPEAFRRCDELEAFRKGLAIFPRAADWLGLEREGRLSHARSAAMDLRQYLRDLAVLQDRVRWRRRLPSLAPRIPQILFRDGRLLPSDHQIGLYEDRTPYGDLVREQIRAAAMVVQALRIVSCVYVGVVKEPEIHFLAPLAFWFAREKRGDKRIEERMIMRPPIGDPMAAYILLSEAARAAGGGRRLAFSFRLMRRFSDIAELRRFYLEFHLEDGGRRRRPIDPARDEDWEEYFRQYVESQRRRYEEGEISVPPLPLEEYAAFRELCQRAAVLMAFILRAEGDPKPVLLPRYEAMIDPTRDVPSQWERALKALQGWAADPGAFGLDEEHDPSLQRPDREALSIPRILPQVAIDAHRAAACAAEELRGETERLLQQAISEIRRILARGGAP